MDIRNIIVARYKEDYTWTFPYERVTIIQKGEDLPNKGREPSSYLHFIINNYDSLEGKYFFLQGDPRDHCPGLASELANVEGEFRWFSDRGPHECNLNGRPHDNVDIKKFLELCDLPYSNNTITFMGCCLFMVSAERIRERPKEFYENMYNIIMNTNNRYEYAFERCVGIIFGDKNG